MHSANNLKIVDPDQLASVEKAAEQDPHCFFIYTHLYRLENHLNHALIFSIH